MAGSWVWGPKLALLAITLASLGAKQGIAGGYCSDFRLSCENGHTYPICPISVSEEGELVTAHLVLGRGRGVHVRLVPMGVGYRYIGRGVWFDGLRGDAILYLRKDVGISCAVEGGPIDAR